MKVAVTGATGFIGHYVLAELSKHDVEVIAIVRPTTAAELAVKVHRVAEVDLFDIPNDVFDRVGRPDALIHLAWGGLPNYMSRHHFESELPAQYDFLKSLVIAGLPKMVTTGTCFEYGMQSGPLHVEMETKPQNPYGFAKDCLRRQLQFLQQQHSFELIWARLFYIYGAGQAKTSLLSQLHQAVENKEAVFNMSGGEQLRDYLHVSIVAKQLVALTLGKSDSAIVNVCSGKPISVRRMVEDWIEDNAYSIYMNLGHYPYPEHEPMAFWGVPAFSSDAKESQI